MTVLQRVRAVLEAEAAAIRAVQVDDRFEQAVALLSECGGTVVTTGMGKAGIVARKFAATLCSSGTPSVYLHPGEAAHGDLGLVRRRDVMVACSTSGKTAEVLEVLDAVRTMYPPVTVIGLTSHKDAPLRSRCDVILDMGTIEEPCPIGLTPSASTTVMLAICDALALAVMEVKGVTRGEFGVRHRAGYLGSRALEHVS